MRKDHSSFQLEDRSTLQDQVTKSIRKAILQGYWKDGEKIRQEDVSRMLNVSRMPVREALKQLAQEGLITFEPRKGAIVNRISEKDIEEVYELRSRLESLCVKLAGPHLSKEDFKVLRSCHEHMVKAQQNEDMEKYVSINRDFHNHLYRKSDWRRLNIIVSTLWNGLPPHTPSLLPDQASFSNEDHERILQFLEQGQFDEASAIMEQHIRRTGAEVLRYVREQAGI